jgi:hypothetical protein
VGLGRAYERAGEPDSAIAAYERYVTTPDFVRSGLDVIELGAVYQRLRELYEARENRAKPRSTTPASSSCGETATRNSGPRSQAPNGASRR